MSVETNEELLTEQLQDMLSAANQFHGAIDRLSNVSPSNDISDTLEQSRKAVGQYRERIEKLSQKYEFPASGKHCDAAAGIVRESLEIDDIPTPDVRGAAIIGFLKRVYGYNVAGFSTSLGLALKLDYQETAESVRECLELARQSRDALDGMTL